VRASRRRGGGARSGGARGGGVHARHRRLSGRQADADAGAARGIDAPIYAVDIDTATGASRSRRTSTRRLVARRRRARRREGGDPARRHVDGAGAFYALKSARRGDTVIVTSDDGKARSYRISSMRRVRKAALPASIYSRIGPRRLVLVTCGGPFDARRGHPRDNAVVTALPR
jgi:Sortase domain